MLYAAGVVAFLASIVAALHYFGTVADEQAAEAARLEDWCRRLAEYEASHPVVFDQDRDNFEVVDVWHRPQSLRRDWFK